jgi:hypothetical protein
MREPIPAHWGYTMLQNITVTELAVERRALWEDFNSREVDDEVIDQPQFEKICALETLIEKSTFKTAADKAAADLILMEDHPSHWDDFQENLFLQMRRFA